MTAKSEPATPRPTPPKPRPPVPGPSQGSQQAPHPVRMPVVEFTQEQIAAASAFGEVRDGEVFVKDGEATRAVGAATGDAPLVPYAKAYLELTTSVEQFHARLLARTLSMGSIENSVAELRKDVEEPAVVGDLAAARARVDEVIEEARQLLDALRAERDEARAEALVAREALVAEAEAIAAKDLAKVHWKDDTATMRSLVDRWKESQRSGARLPKDVEKALWKRLTHARTGFEKSRKHHFAELDRVNADVKGAKERLIARAEELAASTDWSTGAASFARLMEEWKAAGRGRRSTDDALWKRFRAAQDTFFDARRQASTEYEESLSGNVEAKTAVVLEAEALLPMTDVRHAKQALHALQDRFEAAGEVPRAEASRLSKRMAAVERAVREADQEQWNARNPEIEARATGAAAQLHAAIADLEQQIAASHEAGDKDRAASLTEALEARKSWLAQIEGVL